MRLQPNTEFIPQATFEQWDAWADPQAMALRIKQEVNEVAHELGGTFSAEHGISQALTNTMLVFKAPAEIDLMRAIKSVVDPHNLFNPGRLLPEIPARSTPLSVQSSERRDASTTIGP